MTLFQRIQAEIKNLEAEASADFTAFEAKVKALFEKQVEIAATPDSPVAAAPTPAVAVATVLDTTPAAPPAP